MVVLDVLWIPPPTFSATFPLTSEAPPGASDPIPNSPSVTSVTECSVAADRGRDQQKSAGIDDPSAKACGVATDEARDEREIAAVVNPSARPRSTVDYIRPLPQFRL